MPVTTVEDDFEIEAKEDGGKILVARIDPPDGPAANGTGVYARLISYDPTGRHETFVSLIGKRVRISVDVVDGRTLLDGVTAPYPRDADRLASGLLALREPSDYDAMPDDALLRAEGVLLDGARALQSLDDLGSVAFNARAWSAVRELERRLEHVRAEIARRGIRE